MTINNIPKQEFFSFYQQRLANLRQIEKLIPATTIHTYASFNPEFNILLAASLDSLAKYWDLTKLQGARLKGGQRLGEFLVAHANPDIWGRCSRLALLRTFPKDVIDSEKNTLRVEVENISPSIHRNDNVVFGWRDDPKYSDLVTNGKLKKVTDGKWLRQSRYGEILYKQKWPH